MYAILSVILIAIGIMMLFKPRSFYELTQSWKHEGGSGPSDAFLLSARLGGAMFVLAGIGGAIATVLL